MMASLEQTRSLVDVQKEQGTPLSYPESTQIPDENTPLSPGEIEIMRSHSKVSSKICSPSRKASKQKPSFTVYGSPSTNLKTAAKGSREKRKTLQVLQPAADSKAVLVGNSGTIRREEKKDKIKTKSKAVKPQKTLKDNANSTTGTSSDSDSSTTKTTGTNTRENVDNEAFSLMVQDPPPEKYWQLLAEERRIALQSALEENERLCKELEEQKERCIKLEEVASQAEYFANLYSMVMEGETRDAIDSDTNSLENDVLEPDYQGDSDTF